MFATLPRRAKMTVVMGFSPLVILCRVSAVPMAVCHSVVSTTPALGEV